MIERMFDYKTIIEGFNKWLIRNNIKNIIWVSYNKLDKLPEGYIPISDNRLIVKLMESTIEPFECERNSVDIEIISHIMLKRSDSGSSYMYSIDNFERYIRLYYEYRYGVMNEYLFIFDDDIYSVLMDSDSYMLEITERDEYYPTSVDMNKLYEVLTEPVDPQNSVDYWKVYLKNDTRDAAEQYAHNPKADPVLIGDSDLLGRKFILPLKHKKYWLQAIHELKYSFIYLEEDDDDVTLFILILALKTV